MEESLGGQLNTKLKIEEETERHLITKAIHNKLKVEKPPQAVVTPIYTSSTYRFDSCAHGGELSGSELSEIGNPTRGYVYSRSNNPTADSAAQIINTLEEGVGTLAFSSGMAAITTSLLTFLSSGDHMVAPLCAYGGTLSVCRSFLPKWGIEVTWADDMTIEGYLKEIRHNTKVLYAESPCNPMTDVIDLQGFGDLGKQSNVVTIVDSTIGTPYNQQPIKLGVDLVVHSATKFLGGHCDVLAGSVTCGSADLYRRIRHTREHFGNALSPFDAYILERGVKTLHVRMERHNSNALKLAKYLEGHPNVTRVFYPGLPSHPKHDIAKKQMKGFSGLIAFKVKGGLKNGERVVENLKVPTLAVSLGGVESLIEHPASMTHSNKELSPEIRSKAKVTDDMLRLSVGIEDIDDLIADFKRVLDAL